MLLQSCEVLGRIEGGCQSHEMGFRPLLPGGGGVEVFFFLLNVAVTTSHHGFEADSLFFLNHLVHIPTADSIITFGYTGL